MRRDGGRFALDVTIPPAWPAAIRPIHLGRPRPESSHGGANPALSPRRSAGQELSDRLRLVAADVVDQAGRAVGLAGFADIAPVQDQPVMGVELALRRHALLQLVLHRARILARR